MFVARLVCSDPDCAETLVAEAATLAELHALVCDCGCGLQVIGFPDWQPDPEPVGAVVIQLFPDRLAGLSSAA